jgi:EAL and modified HD-GYP domain-containing signal transduction protein
MSAVETPALIADPVCVARQPIFDADMCVAAYELLYRGNNADAANVVDGDAATADVLQSVLAEIGLDRVVGTHTAFVNLTEGFLEKGLCDVLPKERIVLEVLEDVEPTEGVIAALKKLSSRGYKIALDDFEFRKNQCALTEYADIVKVDVQLLDMIAAREQISELRSSKAKLLAEKVETHEEFKTCREMGFELFQGYFFAKPQLLEGKRLPSDRMATLNLISELSRSEITIEEVEALLARDPQLAAKLLTYASSSFCGARGPVESLKRAAVLVGLQRLRTWASLLALGCLTHCPEELLKTAAVRAKMCELLANEHADQHFTVGLLSPLDAFAGRPMSEIVEEMPLSESVKAALLSGEGELGTALACVLAFERGDWSRAAQLADNGEAISAAYLEALDWAKSFSFN